MNKQIKIKNMNSKIKLIGTWAIALWSVCLTASATTVKINQSGISVRDSSGVALTSFSTYGAKLGFFASGFTPTQSNLTNWEENFVSYNGGWVRSSGTFNFGATLGDSASSTNPLTFGSTGYIGGGTSTGVTGFGAAWPVTKQLALLVANIAINTSSNTNAGTNVNYLLPTENTQFALVTDPGWILPATGISSLGTTDVVYAFSSNTTASFGTLSFNSGLNTGSLTLIPEPSSASLLALGVAGLVALRVRRKS
jgi:hypothetical protein